MNPFDFIPLVPLPMLYAETHYRFRYFPFSLYFKREPEIIFDTPSRLEPNADLPVFLLIKDADRFPVRVEEVKVTVYPGAMVHRFDVGWEANSPFDRRCLTIPADRLPRGELSVSAEAVCTVRGKRKIVKQDNHYRLSQAPFSVIRSGEPLPNFPGWSAGEMHCHTSYGGDQVEFGAPLGAYRQAAKAMGLGWVALTDHSYNLDDLPDDYLHNDPALTKWKALHEEAAQLNREGEPLLIPGEELSCRSREGRNIHLVILGEERFLYGSGDGAEKWFRWRSEHSVRSALDSISPDALAVAGHPLVRIPPLERLLVGRGEWLPDDLLEERLDGWQILNGSGGDDFERGLEFWNSALARGIRRPVFAGNDAHGNMNRFRQVKLPMISLWEHRHHLFGRAATRVRVEGELSAASILHGLKRGRAVISEGPALDVIGGGRSVIGETVPADEQLTLRYKSSREFGAVNSIRIVTGDDSYTLTPNDPFAGETPLKMPVTSYFRAELTTLDAGGNRYRAFTNPVWRQE